MDRNPGKDLQPRKIELDGNIGTYPHQIPERILGDDCQNPITEDAEETGKFDVDMPHVQSTMHSDYDSVENIAVASQRVDYESSRKPTTSGKPEAINNTEERASANRTQADDFRRESFKSNSSQEPLASVKPDANQFESSMHIFADPF